MIRFLSFKTMVLSLSCLIAVAFTYAYAGEGCCSGHGGVKGCNQITNHQLCKDGTDSPSCLCGGGKERGCCSNHGGVKKCDKSTGYLLCKDGTHSTTCKCP